LRPAELLVFPLVILFLTNILAYNSISQFDITFKFGNWSFKLGNATNLSAFIGAIGAIVTGAVVAGAKVLESGLSETSVETILKMGLGLTIYAMLVFPVYSIFNSIGVLGQALILGLTISYVLGLMLSINRGG